MEKNMEKIRKEKKRRENVIKIEVSGRRKKERKKEKKREKIMTNDHIHRLNKTKRILKKIEVKRRRMKYRRREGVIKKIEPHTKRNDLSRRYATTVCRDRLIYIGN